MKKVDISEKCKYREYRLGAMLWHLTITSLTDCKTKIDLNPRSLISMDAMNFLWIFSTLYLALWLAIMKAPRNKKILYLLSIGNIKKLKPVLSRQRFLQCILPSITIFCLCTCQLSDRLDDVRHHYLLPPAVRYGEGNVFTLYVCPQGGGGVLSHNVLDISRLKEFQQSTMTWIF